MRALGGAKGSTKMQAGAAAGDQKWERLANWFLQNSALVNELRWGETTLISNVLRRTRNIVCS